MLGDIFGDGEQETNVLFIQFQAKFRSRAEGSDEYIVDHPHHRDRSSKMQKEISYLTL